MTTNSMKGKIALVTGGGTGLGFGAAKKLIEAGAFVYITGRRQEVLDAAVIKLGDKAKAITADASKKSDMLKVADIIQKEQGKLDAVFTNAGFYKGCKLEDLTESDFDAMLNVNLKGQLFTVQAVLPIMPKGSSIILMSSMTAFIGLTDYTAYAATKAAIIGMSKVWANELRHKGIRVNVVSPGAIPTEGYQDVQGLSATQVKEFSDKCAKEIPVGRVGRPEEIGDAVVFLASETSSFINGINIIVDGGQTQVYAGRIME